MNGSKTTYPKTGDGATPTFPEKHIAIAGKGSTQERMTYGGNPMAAMTGGSQDDRVRNIYGKNANEAVMPTPNEITPPADPSGPALDSSKPNIVPV